MISFACSHVTAEGLELFFAWYQKPANKAPLYVNLDCNPCNANLEGAVRGWDDFDHLWISAILLGDGMFASYDNFGGLRSATTNFNHYHREAHRAKGVIPRCMMDFKSTNAESAERGCDWEEFTVVRRFGIDGNGALVPFLAPTTEKETQFFAIKNTLDEILKTNGKESMSPVGIVLDYMGRFCVVDFSAV